MCLRGTALDNLGFLCYFGASYLKLAGVQKFQVEPVFDWPLACSLLRYLPIAKMKLADFLMCPFLKMYFGPGVRPDVAAAEDVDSGKEHATDDAQGFDEVCVAPGHSCSRNTSPV